MPRKSPSLFTIRKTKDGYDNYELRLRGELLGVFANRATAEKYQRIEEQARKIKASNPRTTLVPAKIRRNPKTGKIQIFVTPQVHRALSVRSSNPAFIIKKITGALYNKHLKHLLRAPYKYMPWPVYKLAIPGAAKQYLLIRGGRLMKVMTSKKKLIDYSKRIEQVDAKIEAHKRSQQS